MENIIPFARPTITENEINEVISILKSGWLTMGPKVKQFEKEFSSYIGVKHSIAVNSCTSALFLSLIANDIKTGDEVITTPFTFAATANTIVHSGAKPVFVDIKDDTFNIDANEIRKAITNKTKAIIPVHYAGQPCDMKEINEIADDNNLIIIEDAAHAIGSEYNNNKIGSLNLTCFSFYATKNLTTGDGGMITTNNDKIAAKLRMLRLHGMSHDAWKRYTSKGSWFYDIIAPGYKSNLGDLNAAIGIHQLKNIKDLNNQRRLIAEFYEKELEELPLQMQRLKSNIKTSYHLFPILLKDYDRAKFIEQMKEKGIICSVHFIPLHLTSYYQKSLGYMKGDFPIAESVYEREVSLPIYPNLTEKDLVRITDSIKQILIRKT